MDQAAEYCRERLTQAHVVVDQSSREFDVYKVCEVIFDIMREEHFYLEDGRCMRSCWSSKQDSEWFTDLDPFSEEILIAIYPHLLLTADIDFITSDLAKVWYFVAVCRRLGLDAYPSLRHASARADNTPICCIRPQSADDEPVIVAFSPDEEPTVTSITETQTYQRLVASLPGGEAPGLPNEYKRIVMLGCAPLYKPSHFLLEALWEVTAVFCGFYDENPDGWLTSENETSILAAHALQCLLTVQERLGRQPDIVPAKHLAKYCPLDGQVIMLDVLLADAQNGTRAREVADEIMEEVARSENVDALVRRRSCHPDRPDLPYVGRVAYREKDTTQGFVLDWEVRQRYCAQMWGMSDNPFCRSYGTWKASMLVSPSLTYGWRFPVPSMPVSTIARHRCDRT